MPLTTTSWPYSPEQDIDTPGIAIKVVLESLNRGPRL